MRKTVFLMALMAVAQTIAFAQTLKPLPDGEYNTSANDVEVGVGIPETWKVMANVTNSKENSMDMAVTTQGRYGNTVSLSRFEGNLFAPADRQGIWSTPTNNFVVLQPGGVMELYVYKNVETAPELDRVIAIAAKGAKFGDLKKTAKEHAEAFDPKAANAKLKAANEARKQKLAEEEAAAKAAAAKAAEEKRLADEKAKADREAKAKADAQAAIVAEQNADLCTPIGRYVKMAPTNFKEIQGSKNEEESELEEETVYNTTEKLPLLRSGLIIPTWKEGVSKVQFFSHFSSKADADAHLLKVKAKLDPCFKNKGGFTYNEDSEIHFYKSATVTMELMRSTDIDDEGDTVYKVLIQITKR